MWEDDEKRREKGRVQPLNARAASPLVDTTRTYRARRSTPASDPAPPDPGKEAARSAPAACLAGQRACSLAGSGSAAAAVRKRRNPSGPRGAGRPRGAPHLPALPAAPGRESLGPWRLWRSLGGSTPRCRSAVPATPGWSLDL
ncbi:unnamed protein product [Prorocentrum cordatum]|uniref:Uncharacterized protein n=1 Tax=Prorocentrum cordatum TaxID=2364126 RepID=A0ABN9YD05_9DINO|nr:unnamed protein product [Polarella glacialis]